MKACADCALSYAEDGEIYCREGPPKAQAGAEFAEYPKVKPDWWCGKHAAKVNQMADLMAQFGMTPGKPGTRKI